MDMEPSSATSHLQVIRTLMERAGIYRRALAPIMIFLGILGSAGGLTGWLLSIRTGPTFAAFWIATSLAGVTGAFLIARAQAFKASEPFWSPPTRRVTQGLLPPLFVGLAGTVVLSLSSAPADPRPGWWLLPLWLALYGCALHAAGFFMTRGIRLLGWVYIVLGAALAAWFVFGAGPSELRPAHLAMGLFFGLIHLAYGTYLYFTEQRKNEA